MERFLEGNKELTALLASIGIIDFRQDLDKDSCTMTTTDRENVSRIAAGDEVCRRTKRMGVLIRRPQYMTKGKAHYASRFYYAKMINGALARFPLSSDAGEAERTADQIAGFFLDPTHTLEEARKKFNPKSINRPSQFSTVGELFEFHREHQGVLELDDVTLNGYHHGLLMVLRHVDAWRKGQEFESWSGKRLNKEARLAPWHAKSLSVLTTRLATDYQKLMTPPDLEDEEEEITQKITCDTNLRAAKSLFSKEAMALYKDSDTICLPDLSGFMGVSLFGAKKYFVLQPLSVMKTIFTEALALKATDLNAYRAFLVCTQAGLRKTEAANLRMSWIQDEDDTVMRIHEDGKFKPKHGHGRTVVLDPWAAQEIRSLSAPGEYYLDGNDTERTEKAFDRLNAWLRKCHVDSGKPTHELRKLWFSQKVKRTDLLTAAQQGGHRDVKITQSFYASNQMPAVMLPFWQESTLTALAKVA